MIRKMVVPAFCLAHMVQYDMASEFGCVECHIADEIAGTESDLTAEEYIDIKDEVRIALKKKCGGYLNTIMKHLNDCIEDIKVKGESSVMDEGLNAIIEETLREFVDDSVDWS